MKLLWLVADAAIPGDAREKGNRQRAGEQNQE
jgi:hypothetical protein